MQKILIITNSPKKHQFLENALSDKDTQNVVRTIDDLAFCLDGKNTHIFFFQTGEELKDFSKILVLSTPAHEKNYIFSVLSGYCNKNHIQMYDNVYTNTSGKLYSLWRFWEKDIPVAKTFFGPAEFLTKKLREIGGKGILKSIFGAQGRDNYLVFSEEELLKILKQNPSTPFILQNFIPNEGDWRIILLDYQPKLAIYRTSHGKDYRNNTSVGGEANLVPLEKVDPRIINLAIAAAKSLNIRIAGADILQDSSTGDCTVLEVNRTPQLATGSFVDTKLGILKDFIKS